MSGLRLIVGLGNPGKQYESTRHNVGAWFVDQLARQHNTQLKNETKFHACLGKISQADNQCFLSIPSTFMNESGKAVLALVNFYKIKPQEILVAHDELDFPAGIIRLKEGGGHGGHNGLRDIIRVIGGNNFLRMRIGIGHPGNKDQVTSYVLGKPSKSDEDKIIQSIDEGARVIDDLISGELQRAFHALHSD